MLSTEGLLLLLKMGLLYHCAGRLAFRGKGASENESRNEGISSKRI